MTKTFAENFVELATHPEMRREDAAFLSFLTNELWKENATVTSITEAADGCRYAILQWTDRQEKRLKIEEVRKICPSILLDYFLKDK